MYTSYIGKKFLALYKDKNKTAGNLTAKDFFDEVFFPLFFTDNSHLMHVGNSPFFQKPTQKDVLKHGGKSLAQLNKLREKIEAGVPSGAIYVGYAAEEIQATSSGQLTSINRVTTAEEVYTSWIGEALGIGVNGGFVMLIDEPEILWALFKGWQYYRKFLMQTPNVKDKQIETWNGLWLSLYLNSNGDAEAINLSNIKTKEVVGNIAIPTQKWSQIIFILSKKYGSKTLTAYCYNLSQTNTTLGFINIYLAEVKRFYQIRDKVFLDKEQTILADKEIEELETFFNFKSACISGTIGLKSFEPAKLRAYMPRGSVEYAQGLDFKFTDDNSFFIFQLYKLWIIAMLNKTELLELASKIAEALLVLENEPDNRGKKDLTALSDKVRESTHLKVFIENLRIVLERSPSNANVFKDVVMQILKMPADNFPLFVTLIRFEYTFQKSK